MNFWKTCCRLPAGPALPASQAPFGFGTAVWAARDIVGDDRSALLLPDMIMRDEIGCLSGMVELYGKVGGNIVAVGECDPAQAHRYGIVGQGDELDGGFRITAMVEKPAQGTAPSNYYISGRYILQPEIFEILSRQESGAGNEIQVTDAMLKLAGTQPFSAYRFGGQTYDCGSKEGFILANVAYALDRADIRPLVAEGLKDLIAKA